MESGYFYDEAKARHVIEFSERFLTHQKGELAGQPFILDEWQIRDIVSPLFGWRRADGTRKHRQSTVFVSRKNGKSTLAVLIALYCLFCDNEPGAEVYCCAADTSQAAIVFDLAKGMVEASPALRKRCKVYRRSIVVPATGSVFRVLSSDASTKHGFNASCVIYDEVHAWKSRELYDVLHTSTGARRQPLEFVISTAGVYEPESIAWQLYHHAKQVKEGALEDPALLPCIYEAPADADYRQEDTWIAANPGLGRSVKLEYLAGEAKRAAGEPSYENTFRRLHLGQWTQQVTRWIQLEAWDACKQERPNLDGRVAYAGLDLSTTTDISSCVLAFPPQTTGEPTWIVPHFWIPRSKLSDKRDRVPYLAWERMGLVTVTEGDILDYGKIRADLNALAKRYRLKELRYDRWNATQLATQLAEEDGFTMTQVGMGFASLSAPTKELERQVVGGLLAHDGNPVLRWMVSNVAVRTDPAGNLKPDKSKSTERIDGVVATILALSGTMTARPAATPRVMWL